MVETFIPDALKTALDFEEKGRNFYSKTAETVSDPLSKELFKTLAEDEIKHAEKIRAIYQGLSQEQPLPEADVSHQHQLEAKVRKFFEAHRSEITKETSNIEGYEFAMEMEKTGVEMYRKFADQTDHAGEKAFYQMLIKEEMEHLEALRNVHFFLTDAEDWLAQDESQHWNWMNL
jgi:rubrerythrin